MTGSNELSQMDLGFTSGFRSVTGIANSLRVGRSTEAVDLTSTADVLDRSVVNGYQNIAYPALYEGLAFRQDVKDFSQAKGYRVGSGKEVPEVPRGGQYTSRNVGEESFSWSLRLYGETFSSEWQDRLRDQADLNMISGWLQSWGLSAAYTRALLWARAYEANTTIFTGGHGNTVTTPLSAASLDTAIQKMRNGFTDNDGNPAPYMGPLKLVVPPALARTAHDILYPIRVGQGLVEGTAPAGNYFAGMISPATDAFLTSATGWYVFADPAIRPAFRWGQLAGYPPVEIFMRDSGLRQLAGGADVPPDEGDINDAIVYKLRMTFGVDPLDFRGAYHSDGTA